MTEYKLLDFNNPSPRTKRIFRRKNLRKFHGVEVPVRLSVPTYDSPRYWSYDLNDFSILGLVKAKLDVRKDGLYTVFQIKNIDLRNSSGARFGCEGKIRKLSSWDCLQRNVNVPYSQKTPEEYYFEVYDIERPFIFLAPKDEYDEQNGN